MRVLIFHGYLLRGTGSNVYNAELAAALVRGGHDVHLLSQDRTPLELDDVPLVDVSAVAVRPRSVSDGTLTTGPAPGTSSAVTWLPPQPATASVSTANSGAIRRVRGRRMAAGVVSAAGRPSGGRSAGSR